MFGEFLVALLDKRTALAGANNLLFARRMDNTKWGIKNMLLQLHSWYCKGKSAPRELGKELVR